MFLVQINELSFIDLEKVECVFFDVNSDRLCIAMTGAQNGDHYHVDPKMVNTVVNNIKAFDSGISRVEALNKKAAN